MSVFGRSVFDENMSLRKNAIGKYIEIFVSSPIYLVLFHLACYAYKIAIVYGQ